MERTWKYARKPHDHDRHTHTASQKNIAQNTPGVLVKTVDLLHNDVGGTTAIDLLGLVSHIYYWSQRRTMVISSHFWEEKKYNYSCRLNDPQACLSDPQTHTTHKTYYPFLRKTVPTHSELRARSNSVNWYSIYVNLTQDQLSLLYHS